ELLGIRAVVGKTFSGGQFVLVMGVIVGNFGPALGAATLHERGVDDDARKPGGELRAAFKALEIAIGRKQSGLQGVRRILGVAENTKRGLEQRTVVAAKESF